MSDEYRRVLHEVPGKFRFRVREPRGGYGYDANYWTVELPHSCDAWVISSKKDQGQVVRELQEFIREAQLALGVLRQQIREKQAPAIAARQETHP